MSDNMHQIPGYRPPASSVALKGRLRGPLASDPPVQGVSTAAIEPQEDALAKYQDAVDTLIAAAEINSSPAVDEAASKDRRSTLLFSSILIVLASGYASLDSAHNAGGIKIKDIADVIKEINISLKHILFLLLALSTYYLISFLVASYRSLKRWGLRRQVWQQRAASLVTVPYLESQKALESVKEAAEEMKNKATRRAEQLRKSSGTDAIADVDDPMDFMRDFEAIKDLEADFDEANKRVKVVTDTATVMQRSRLISICIDIVFPCMLYIGSVFTLVAWLRHQ